MTCRARWHLCAALAFALIIPPRAHPETDGKAPISYCDPALFGAAEPRGYHDRDDRCEGIFASRYNALQLLPRSVSIDVPTSMPNSPW